MNKEKIKQDKRVIFHKNKQFYFLDKARKKLNISWPLFAKKIKVNNRCLNDWKREKYSLPFNVLKRICKITGLKFPDDIEIRQPFWSVQKAGQVAGKNVYKKYGIIGGDPEYRKRKWYEWWEREGKYKINTINTVKSVTKPALSEELAEFVGVMLGDGSITQRQIAVTLNSRDDKKYGEFVFSLMKNLFKVPVGVSYRENHSTNTFVISRVELVRFFVEKLGLKIGSKIKHQVDIPEWIKLNKKYSIACLRGLMDTDGCVFNECHKINKINKKIYCYPRLSFVNYSRPLLVSVFNILKELNFDPKIRNNRSVQLEKKNEIIRYFEFIKSNNPKHLVRLNNFLGGVG